MCFLGALLVIEAVLAADPFSDALLSLKSEIRDDSNSLADWFLPSGVKV